MGMLMHVVGFVPPDDEWCKMKAVYDACAAAEVDAPKDVLKFFGMCEMDEGGGGPDAHGREVGQEAMGSAVTKWSDDYRNGYEVEVAKLPKNIKVLRFYCSW